MYHDHKLNTYQEEEDNMQTQYRKEKQLTRVNNDWFWTYPSDNRREIVQADLKWWERILYWKFPDKSYKQR